MTTQKYDYHCGRCGGLVAEPMKAYGYSGQFCHCPEPTPAVFTPQQFMTTQTEELANEWLALQDGTTQAMVATLLTQERTRLKEELTSCSTCKEPLSRNCTRCQHDWES